MPILKESIWGGWALDEKPTTARRVGTTLLAVLLLGLSGLAGIVVARWTRSDTQAADTPPVKFPNRHFESWPAKPDVVLLITGQQHGYLSPCGCSVPQIGGLERRYNLIQMMKKAGWSVVPIDLGDVPQTAGPAGLPNQQGLTKYVYAMKAMKKMDYAGVGFGRHEATLGLFTSLGAYSLNDPQPPVLMSNLMDADSILPGMTKPWYYADTPGGVRVGVTAIMGPSKGDEIREQTRLSDKARFAVTGETLDNVLTQMTKGSVTLPILMYHGSLGATDKKTEACAAAYPQFPIVVCDSTYEEPELKPTLVPTKAGTQTLMIQAGKKGKYVVVVGAWKTAKGFDFKYERVEIAPEFATPDDKVADHPILKLMEEYTAHLRDNDFLGKYGQTKHPLQVMAEVPGLRTPGEAQYVGSEACKRCHEDAYGVWKKSGHSHAFDTLVKAKNPSNRQFDPECIVCHTVGFGYKTGYIDEKKTPKLKDVGCESCHGPASLHVRNPNNEEWQKRLNPWRHMPVSRDKQLLAIDIMCQKCHDMENDVHWTDGGFKKKWPKIEHPTPKPPDDK